MNLERRIHQLEYHRLVRDFDRIAAPMGLPIAFVMHELLRYLNHPDDRMETFEATLSPGERQELVGMKARWRRILQAKGRL